MCPFAERVYGHSKRVDVIDRQRLHKHTALGIDAKGLKKSVNLHNVGDNVAVRQHGPLRDPGRPTCVLQHRQISEV